MILAKRKLEFIQLKSKNKKLWQSVGTARFIYDYTLMKQEELTDISLGIDLGLKRLGYLFRWKSF